MVKGLIQRVTQASVTVFNGQTCQSDVVGEIAQGILLLLGVCKGDTHTNADQLLQKVLNYRIFPDQQGRMNLNLLQSGGGLLVVSQFTLAADTQKGLRPSFSAAAAPDAAEKLYNYFLTQAQQQLPSKLLASGVFGADMQVMLCNDGPVTFLLDM